MSSRKRNYVSDLKWASRQLLEKVYKEAGEAQQPIPPEAAHLAEVVGIEGQLRRKYVKRGPSARAAALDTAMDRLNRAAEEQPFKRAMAQAKYQNALEQFREDHPDIEDETVIGNIVKRVEDPDEMRAVLRMMIDSHPDKAQRVAMQAHEILHPEGGHVRVLPPDDLGRSPVVFKMGDELVTIGAVKAVA